MENRQRNEIYKTRSIGYKGEAMDSLARATELTIISKEVSQRRALIVKFNSVTRQVETKAYHSNIIKLGEQGTIIQVRHIHKHNPEYRKKYIKHNKNQYEHL
jgi:DNA mismatch repair ATPase MutL